MGGIAAIAGLFFRTVKGTRGAMDLDALREAVQPSLAANKLYTALICMETTHNDAGGVSLPLDHMASVHALGHEHKIPVHTDGARLFNAAIHLGVPAKEIAKHTDTLTFCVSKGLSAPIGSVLVGSNEFIARARAFRRMVGGNLRQGGVVAAAGVVALEQMVDRLADDHRSARALAEGLNKIDKSFVDLETVETNIVQVDTHASGRTASQWLDALKGRGVLAGVWSPWKMRLVTHRHIGPKEVEATIEAFRAVA
jgi:threonine aldolase